ncbi:thioredoxin-like protein [Roseivirga pacifica]|uniref:Thioredoxin-like n=1 Tax=Roseivirga pacifica TaxID=1267423 RepID=A0A1I0MZT7_9BACT|nr:TlpA disulfide reductase family protein [Roseivirga pacifica]RKQ50811.1 thioredoxin-like protein [Roseivirga pacifica]SEV94045.1 Thioredoxin-like [Roseivirga pacifica]
MHNIQRNFIILLLISIAFISCDKREPYVLVGTIDNYKSDSIGFYLPLNGKYMAGANTVKVPIDTATGQFTLEVSDELDAFVTFYSPAYGNYITTWAEAGKKDSVVMDWALKDAPKFYGDHEKALNFYYTRPRMFIYHAWSVLENKYMKDSLATDTYKKIMKEYQLELDTINQMLAEESISEEFARGLKYDSRYHWKTLFSAVAWHHYYYKNLLKRKSVYNDDWEAVYKKLFEEEDLNNSEALMTRYYSDFLKDYRLITQQWNGYERDTTLNASDAADAYHNQNIEIIRDSYEGQVEEYVWAGYLAHEGLQKKFEKSLLKSFDDFKQVYPESAYLSHVSKYIDPIADYYKKLERPMDDDIIFRADAMEYTSWEEIVAPHKGEIIYVDMWATWCGPCKDEFKHKDGLKEFIKDKPIKVLYVSSDRDEYEDRWKEMVQYYDLEGENMRISQDLYWKIWGMIHDKKMSSLPRYLIVDREGNMVVKEAKRPSDGQALYDQLAEQLMASVDD